VAREDDTEDVAPVVTSGAEPLVVKVPSLEVVAPAEFSAFTQNQYFVPAASPVTTFDTACAPEPVTVVPAAVVAEATLLLVDHAQVTVASERAPFTVPARVAPLLVMDDALPAVTTGADWVMVTVRVAELAAKYFVPSDVSALLDAPIWHEPAE